MLLSSSERAGRLTDSQSHVAVRSCDFGQIWHTLRTQSDRNELVVDTGYQKSL
jgi:hypothetical protein